jgi:hypothetical protein
LNIFFKSLLIQSLICTTSLQVVHADTSLNDHTPSSGVEIVDLRSIFKLPLGQYGLEFDSKFLSLNQHLVKITGYIVKSGEPALGNFLLSVRPVQLHRDDDGQADDLPASTIKVLLDPSQSNLKVPYAPGLHTFRGTLQIGRLDSTNEPVSWISLQLPIINH